MTCRWKAELVACWQTSNRMLFLNTRLIGQPTVDVFGKNCWPIGLRWTPQPCVFRKRHYIVVYRSIHVFRGWHTCRNTHVFEIVCASERRTICAFAEFVKPTFKCARQIHRTTRSPAKWDLALRPFLVIQQLAASSINERFEVVLSYPTSFGGLSDIFASDRIVWGFASVAVRTSSASNH